MLTNAGTVGVARARCPCYGVRGLTLVESVLSMVIVAVLIVMALNTFGGAAKGGQVTMSRCIGDGLASQLMTEVFQSRYADPVTPGTWGPDSGENTGTRALFNAVDDYDHWVETSPKMKDGSALDGLTGWKREVWVDYVHPATLSLSGTNLGLKRITVDVTSPQNAKTTLVALRSANGSFDQAVTTTTTCVSWVGVELQATSDAASKLVSGAGLPNVVP